MRLLTKEEYEFTHEIMLLGDEIYREQNRSANFLFVGEEQKQILYNLPNECFNHKFSEKENKVISFYYNLEIIHVDRLNFLEVM